MKITLYTITDCKFSQEEKEYLKSINLPFDEKNLEQNKDWLTEMLTVSNNFAGTPVTVIEKDDGSKVVLKGFTKAEFEKELNVKSPAMGAVTTEAGKTENGIGNDVMAGIGAAGTSAAAAMPAQAPAAPEPVAPAIPEPATPAMPEPATPVAPAPAAPEPVMPAVAAMPPVFVPEILQTPVMSMEAPAPAPVFVPDLSAGVMVGGDAPAVAPSAEPPMPSMASMPEPAVPLMASAPAAPEPAAIAPTTPTEAPAAPAAAAPQVNDDALNAILNNLQSKVSDTPVETPKQ